MDQTKILLPSFLKLLTSKGMPTPKAMSVASKIYKEFNTPATISQLTDAKLLAVGVEDKDTRKATLVAFRASGYRPTRKALTKQGESGPLSAELSPTAGSSSAIRKITPTKRKRKHDDDVNEFLPKPSDEAATYGSLQFDEILDERILSTKFCVVNRAPVMTAWSFIVAERLGFSREEALSIASVYTEMNAVSKGVSLAIFEPSRNNGMEAKKGGSQPYVELMGRNALYQAQSGSWRALANNTPAQPSAAFSYISRAFRQNTGFMIGALRALASTYSPQELNDQKGFGLYAQFRPDVEGWGGRGEVRCDKILALRKHPNPTSIKEESEEPSKPSAPQTQEEQGNTFVKVEPGDPLQELGKLSTDDGEPERKKARGMSLEEYEAALDQDHSFDDIEF
ncbi:hypothetical protein FIBSPDRAFT_722131 [Athelia psychrophila]|uniref:Uncharacterized protein n=1 Tax=Athelia psychrophila TaxID=1759441 RepID=A0A166VQU3_9AGAM|nr:hypothetical protein FIBSPDRAFT_722131 [Fibularhizoctonia sp. CBS 109695]